MNIVIWIILSSFGCVFQCKAGNIRHTNCTDMEWITRNWNHHLECRDDEVIYIDRQDMRHTDGRIYTPTADVSQCENKEIGYPNECFRSVPHGFGEDFTSYFNASQKCNRMNTCGLGYNDFYDSTLKFIRYCSVGGERFDKVLIIVYYECFSAERNILVGGNRTAERLPDRPLYLMATKGNMCRIKGNIESGRILEQANMNLTIRQGNNRICSEILGIYHYNKDLSCIRGLSGIIFDFKIYNPAVASTKMLWIEIKGRSLQLVCGDITEALSEQPQESSPALFIAGPVVGVVLLGVVVLVIVLKRRKSQMLMKNMPKCDGVTTTLPPFQGQGGPDSNDVLKPKNEEDRVSSSNTTYYNMDIPEFPLQVEDGNYSLISSQAQKTIAGEKQAVCHNTEHLGDGVYDSMDENPTTHSLSAPCAENLIVHREEIETETTNGEHFIGEVTGDVYASVCKVDKVENKQITGPKGDIYATVSNVSSRE